MSFESCQKNIGPVPIFNYGLKIVLELQKNKEWKTKLSKYRHSSIYAVNVGTHKKTAEKHGWSDT